MPLWKFVNFRRYLWRIFAEDWFFINFSSITISLAVCCFAVLLFCCSFRDLRYQEPQRQAKTIYYNGVFTIYQIKRCFTASPLKSRKLFIISSVHYIKEFIITRVYYYFAISEIIFDWRVWHQKENSSKL
jgi:hypothetical protein